MLVLVCFLLLPSLQALRFGSSQGPSYLLNYTSNDWCEPSFECSIMSFLCEKISSFEEDNCTLTIFDALEERLTSLEENKVDIVVSRFSVTPERSDRVNFVRPYYYSSGAQVFVLPEDKSQITSFDQLAGFQACIELGYYAEKGLYDQFGIVPFPAEKSTMKQLMQQKYCVASITDSVFVLDGLVQEDLDPEYEVPYGVAISKSPTIPNLEQLVQDALIEMFLIDMDGMSQIEAIEEQYLKPQGINKNTKLGKLVEAINNTGSYVGTSIEDEIWQIANLTSTSLLEELMFADPDNLQQCQIDQDLVYQSYINGTPIDQLPIITRNNLVYTYVANITGYTNLSEEFIMLQHPFQTYGITAPEMTANNPQFPAVIKGLQDGLLSDPNNLKDGTSFYFWVPFDSAPIFAGNFSNWQMIFSPTRVIKTLIGLTFEGRRQEEGSLFYIGCGVGETRDW
eukprot:TRINITY_DN252_c0_g1_i2.p1 TRINITY_DN252_c0_g1~~TRINITY_DN252_c0_g1_i2.p1  ORF type:complete len:453 (+),score=43.62 TRINITY_DN252_c0_g1_i2:158-1516(+)